MCDDSGDLADHRRVLRAARLEQLDDARQTAGDVLGLGGLARDLGQHVARVDLVALVHHEVRADGELVAPLAAPAVSEVARRWSGCAGRRRSAR